MNVINNWNSFFPDNNIVSIYEHTITQLKLVENHASIADGKSLAIKLEWRGFKNTIKICYMKSFNKHKTFSF